MFKRPNFFLLCIIHLPKRRHRLILPFPIFLIDQVLEAIESLVWVLAVAVPQRGMRGRHSLIPHAILYKILPGVREAWRKVRMSGSYTLLEVKQESGLGIFLRLI